MGLLSIVLNEIGLNLGWVYLFMGIVVGSAVVPVSLVLTWRKATAKGAITGAVVGQLCAVIAWLVSDVESRDSSNSPVGGRAIESPQAKRGGS